MLPARPKIICASIATAAFAMLLAGSPGTAVRAENTKSSPDAAAAKRMADAARQIFAEGRYSEARDSYRRLAAYAERRGLTRTAAWAWNNSAVASSSGFEYRLAIADLTKARQLAETHAHIEPELAAAANLAGAYLHTGKAANAERTAREALASPGLDQVPGTRAVLRCQLAEALAEQHRFSEALPEYRLGINDLLDQGNVAAATLALGGLGHDSLAEGNLEQAEWALGEGLRLARNFKLPGIPNILRNLGKLRGVQGRPGEAAALFEAALRTPPGATARWPIYMDRGQFRAAIGDYAGALEDFRESRSIAASLRTEIVPVDQDRVALESSTLRLVYEGLVDAGNRIARQSGNTGLLRETFDVAEQDRLWSLRALVPSPNDWRTRLPASYWTLLSQYQSVQRQALAQSGPNGAAAPARAASLKAELERIETQAAGDSEASAPKSAEQSALDHVRRVLAPDSVLLSFHVTETSSWVWAVDSKGVGVWPLPPLPRLRDEIQRYRRLVTAGDNPDELGLAIYRDLFGQIPGAVLQKDRWLLELDGPLYELPFAGLVTGYAAGKPVYLVETAALQSIPSALLLERGTLSLAGGFLGIGDPVYNAADPRFRGPKSNPGYALPRLPGTAAEVEACALEWRGGRSDVLTGSAAALDPVRDAMRRDPSVIHFATHVVSAPGDFRSGMIALSLDSSGAMGLLGPREIVARPVHAGLVVLDGCHSAQGESLPSSGLMGLTRAWIGAGAGAVLATQWDIPDDGARTFMQAFYSTLRSSPEKGAAFALRQAQLETKSREPGVTRWAGYFLLGKVQ